MERKAVNRHTPLRVVWEVEMLCDWFRSVCIVDFVISHMFKEAIAKPAPCFAAVDYFTFFVQVLTTWLGLMKVSWR